MGNLFGLGDWMSSDIRLNGIGWIGAIFVVGLSILASRLVVHWQLRRVERILSPQEKAGPAEEKAPGADP